MSVDTPVEPASASNLAAGGELHLALRTRPAGTCPACLARSRPRAVASAAAPSGAAASWQALQPSPAHGHAPRKHHCQHCYKLQHPKLKQPAPTGPAFRACGTAPAQHQCQGMLVARKAGRWQAGSRALGNGRGLGAGELCMGKQGGCDTIPHSCMGRCA